MTITRKTVLLVGATGATGNAILQELVASQLYVSSHPQVFSLLHALIQLN